MTFLNIFLLTILILLSFVLPQPVWSAHVVTDETRQWAEQALQEEATLDAAKGRRTLAVLYFHNQTGQKELDPLQKGLSFMLTTDLSKVSRVQVIERVKLQALTEEMKLGISGLVDTDTSPKVGALLGAEWLVGGNIVAGGDNPLQVDSSLLDVPDREILGQPSAAGVLERFLEIEKNILFGLIDLLQIELTPEEKVELEKPISTDMNALLDLFKAMHSSDMGNYEQAEQYSERAIQRDPAIAPAKELLNELKVLGRISPVRKENRKLLHTIKRETSLTDILTTSSATTKRQNIPDRGTVPTTIEITVPQL